MSPFKLTTSGRRTLDEFNQRTDGNSGGTFGAIRRGRVSPRRAGYVQMRPGDAVGELFQKRRRRYCPRFFSAHVLDVGDVTLNLIAIFTIERQLPELFAHFPSRGDDLIDQRLIGAEDRCVDVTQSNRNRTGKSRHVDDLSRAEFFGLVYRSSQT